MRDREFKTVIYLKYTNSEDVSTDFKKYLEQCNSPKSAEFCGDIHREVAGIMAKINAYYT